MKLTERSGTLKQIRAANMVPGVIYGKKISSTPVQVEYKDFMKHYHDFGTSMTFKVKYEGKTHQVYIKEVQVDPLNLNNFLHFDLIKVSASDTISADIPVYLSNKDKVEAKGLIVQLIAQTVLTEYQVGKGVSNFTLDVSTLEQGDAIYIKDIELAEGLKILDDPEKMVVNVTLPSMEEEPEESADDEEVEVEAIKQKGEEAPADDEE